MTGAMTSDRGHHRQVPLDLVQGAELRQPERQRPVCGVLAGVEQRAEEVVPGVEEREQPDRRDGGLGQAQDDGEQDAQLPAAVDARGVGVLLGMVRKNWRSRKIVNASPNQLGMISGHSVPTRCSLAHIT